MSLYSKYILPRAIHFACKQKPTTYQRKKVVPLASGSVIEIGIGTGLNIPHYDSSQVEEVIGIDPGQSVWDLKSDSYTDLSFHFEFVKSGAENMPFESNRFDTAVVTYTLCTIPDLERALEEIRRVLKPHGQLIFSEHGKAPDAGVRRMQSAIEPVWKVFSGGCHLTRDIPGLISTGGFEITQLDEMYIPGWKPGSYNYWGVAKPR